MDKRHKIKCCIAFLFFIFTVFFLILDKSDEKILVNTTESCNELFDASFKRLNSVSKVIIYVDSVYLCKNLAVFDTAAYVNIVSVVLKNKFYHGLSEYTIYDNWIANLCGKYVWSHFSAIVEPEDILKYSEGLCSQQTIVFLAILKRKGISYRTVGLGPKEGPGHFLSEVLYNGTWHLYDVDKEPRWEKTSMGHKSIDYYRENPDTLYSVYNEIIDIKILSQMIKTISYGNVNELPAKNMLLFHRITKILIYLLPVFFLCVIIILLFQNKRLREKK